MYIYMQNRQTSRYYSLTVEQDLFDEWCLKKVYGSLNNARGRVIIKLCESENLACEELFKIECAKRQRGYIYVDLENEQPRQYSANVVDLKVVSQPIKVKVSHPMQLELFSGSTS